MDFEYMANPSLTREECRTLVAALDSYIRRMTRDYNHKERMADMAEGHADDLARSIRARLQDKQARIEAAKELREKMNGLIEETYTWQRDI
jgi:hypothetical protein